MPGTDLTLPHVKLDDKGHATEAAGTFSLQFAKGQLDGQFSGVDCDLAAARVNVCIWR